MGITIQKSPHGNTWASAWLFCNNGLWNSTNILAVIWSENWCESMLYDTCIYYTGFVAVVCVGDFIFKFQIFQSIWKLLYLIFTTIRIFQFLYLITPNSFFKLEIYQHYQTWNIHIQMPDFSSRKSMCHEYAEKFYLKTHANFLS